MIKCHHFSDDMMRVDEKVLLTWVSSSDSLLIVTENSVIKTRLSSSGGEGSSSLPASGGVRSSSGCVREEVVSVPHPVLSAWLSSDSGHLSLLTSHSVLVINTHHWTISHTFTRTQQQSNNTQQHYNNSSWICEIPSAWFSDMTGKISSSSHLHVVSHDHNILVLDINTKKYWFRRRTPATRGQFLAEFINYIVPSLSITKLGELTALVSTTLKCSFLQSRVLDMCWTDSCVIIQTRNGDVWRLDRTSSELQLMKMMTRTKMICLNHSVLTAFTEDNAVYKIDINQKTESINKNVHHQTSLHAQTDVLEATGKVASNIDQQLSQVQLYQSLFRKEGAMEEHFKITVDIDTSEKIIRCSLKVVSDKLKFLGKFWCLEAVLKCHDQKNNQSCSVCLPAALSSYSEPVSASISVLPATIPREVDLNLIFRCGTEKEMKVFPSLRLGTRKIDLLDLLTVRAENTGCSLRQTEESLFNEMIILTPQKNVENHRGFHNDIFLSNIKDEKLKSLLSKSQEKQLILKFSDFEVNLKGERNKSNQSTNITFFANNTLMRNLFSDRIILCDN